MSITKNTSAMNLVERLRDIDRNPPTLRDRQQIADALESLAAANAALTEANGKWTEQSAELRVQLAEAEALLREWAIDALDDLNNWSGYATEYFQQKHDLAGDQAKWQARIDAHLARQP